MDEGQNSGDYIFRPVTGQYTPNVYSKFNYGKKNGNLEMTFYFEKQNNFTFEIEMRAIVSVMIDEELRSVKFDVDLDSLPEIEYG